MGLASHWAVAMAVAAGILGSQGCHLVAGADEFEVGPPHHGGSAGTAGAGAGGEGAAGGAEQIPASCRALLAAQPATSTGSHLLDTDGPGGNLPFEAWCDMDADSGGWTLVASVVNVDGQRSWDTGQAWSGSLPFGRLSQREQEDFKSEAYGWLVGDDLLIRTDEYEFSMHDLLGSQSLAAYLASSWPQVCATSWRHEGLDYYQGLRPEQARALGFMLRAEDHNEGGCFPQGGPEAAAVVFLGGDSANFGLGNSTAAAEWGSWDLSLPTVATFQPHSCIGPYPCNTAQLAVHFNCYDGSCKSPFALVFVR